MFPNGEAALEKWERVIIM